MPTPDDVTLAHIRAAHERLTGLVVRTPLGNDTARRIRKPGESHVEVELVSRGEHSGDPY